tara:strand:+ start:55 stop:738 length:684 start_codon:yes stop_codon:yes gene_type:complete
MAFKMKGFPMHKGISPMRNMEDDPSSGDQSDLVEEDSSAGNTLVAGGTSELGTLTDDERAADEKRIADKKAHELAALNRTTTVIDPATGKEIAVSTEGGDDTYKTTGDDQEPKEWYNKKAFKETGIGHITDAFRSIGKGIKNRKAKKSAKKAEELASAKTAVGSGSETLKQAKVVERNRNKTDKKAKKEIEKAKKDKLKLAKYREKNPVRGKEAIKLLDTQTKKLKS